MKEAKNILLIAGTYVATVIGAGFASGQEILSFFVIYGRNSILGLLIVLFMFTFGAAFILERVYKSGIDSFGDYMLCVSNAWWKRIFEYLCAVSLLCGFCAMAAGSGELLYGQFGWNRFFGTALMIAVCTAVFLFDLKGILTLNSLLAPIMTVGLILLGICAFVFRDDTAFLQFGAIRRLTENWVVSAVVYGAYNLFTASVILCEMRPLIHKRSTPYLAAGLGAVILVCIAVVIWAAIKLYYGKILLGQMPLFTIAARQGALIENAYAVIVYLSMFTTAVSCGYGFMSMLKGFFHTSKPVSILALVLISVPICSFGFEGIVKNIYAAFGYLGLPLILFIFADGRRMHKVRICSTRKYRKK